LHPAQVCCRLGIEQACATIGSDRANAIGAVAKAAPTRVMARALAAKAAFRKAFMMTSPLYAFRTPRPGGSYSKGAGIIGLPFIAISASERNAWHPGSLARLVFPAVSSDYPLDAPQRWRSLFLRLRQRRMQGPRRSPMAKT